MRLTWIETLGLGEERTLLGRLRLYPVLGREPVGPRTYVTLEEALSQGRARIAESGTVGQVVVEVGEGLDVLVCAGTLLAGGLQNRAVHTSVLLEAGRGHVVPVSCVEAHRWSPRGSRNLEFHLVAGRADTALRAVLARRGVDQGRGIPGPGPDQLAVWEAVGSRLRMAGVYSATSNLLESYAGVPELEELDRQVWPPDQVGAVVAAPGGWCLDVFDHPETWRNTAPRLLRGYVWAWDGGCSQQNPDPGGPRVFLERVAQVLSNGFEIRAPVGRGRQVFAASGTDTAVALVDGGRVVHLFAYAGHGLEA